MSEFDGSGRQSRIAIKAIGKLPDWTMTGYYEMDWLGTGITSNNNQSNSYVIRQRQLWADAKLNNGWDFSGGQGWSLATETTQGLTSGTEILPGTIDPQYDSWLCLDSPVQLPGVQGTSETNSGWALRRRTPRR